MDALDGIRVLAILGVIIYHFNASLLPGGFLGVTVFFVLSGYLITGGLCAQLSKNGRIGYKRYFFKRVRRLWPTMLTVVVVIALLTAIFSPTLLEKMRPDAIPSLLFAENWWKVFSHQSYFAAAGLPSPLTHFWFLGVLFQFYLVWPLIMWGVWKLAPSKRVLRRVSLGLLVASFVLMVLLYDPEVDVSRIYYGTDTRLAELMVGAYLAFLVPISGMKPLGANDGSTSSKLHSVRLAVRNHVISDIIGIAGIVAIVVMAFMLNGFSQFLYRGGLLLVAVLTALVVLAVVNPKSLLGKVLGAKPMQIAGSRSYALYMWHYPLLLIMNPANRTTELPWWGYVLEVAAIIVAAELNYRLVEKHTGEGQIGRALRAVRRGKAPLRRVISPYKSVSYAVGIATIAAIVVLVLGPVGYAGQEFGQEALQSGTSSTSSVQETDSSGSNTADESQTNEAETLSNLGNAILRSRYEVDPKTGATDIKVLLIGDSVPLGTQDIFSDIFPKGKLDAEVGRQVSEGSERCKADLADYDPDVVVYALGANGVADEEDVMENIEAAGNRPVYLVNVRVPQSQQDINNDLYKKIADENDNVYLIDWYGDSKGHDDWFWDDGTHLRPEGAKAYLLMIRKALLGE
ncbi:MAG: acyltransferase family protein [Coriobacteriales bacterium]